MAVFRKDGLDYSLEASLEAGLSNIEIYSKHSS